MKYNENIICNEKYAELERSLRGRPGARAVLELVIGQPAWHMSKSLHTMLWFSKGIKTQDIGVAWIVGWFVDGVLHALWTQIMLWYNW